MVCGAVGQARLWAFACSSPWLLNLPPSQDVIINEVMCSYCRMLLIDATTSLEHVSRQPMPLARAGKGGPKALLGSSHVGGATAGTTTPAAAAAEALDMPVLAPIVISRVSDLGNKFVCSRGRGLPSVAYAPGKPPPVPFIEFSFPNFFLLDEACLHADLSALVGRKPRPQPPQLAGAPGGDGAAAGAGGSGGGAC